MTLREKIIKARTLLIIDHPFFGSLILRLKMEEDSGYETAFTDGEHIFYNPKYVEGLSLKETVGMLAHIVMHAALGHIWRMGERESEKWNKATDYTINENLIASGFTLPKGHLVDTSYRDMSAEEIYSKLPTSKSQQQKDGQQSGNNQQSNSGGNGGNNSEPNQQKQKGQNQPNKQGKGKNKQQPSSDPGKCGGVLSSKSKQQEKETKSNWQAAVAQALAVSKGDLPGDFRRKIADECLNPPLPWHVLLRDFVEKTARNDYDWTRPSKRYITTGVVLPSLVSEELPEVVIAIDTSGSIDDEALNEFAMEASNVLGAYDTTVRVIYCDAKVQGEQEFKRADMPMKLEPVGGGGTNFKPVFDYVNKKGFTPCCLIYFTDMYGNFPNKEPDYPVMWLTKTKDKKAPFGKTVLFR